MNNEENTKEKVVEELAVAMTEGMGEEVAKTPEKVVEINLEDPAEEPVVEEPVAEEAVVEETTAEETADEEPVEEETTTEAPVVEETPVAEPAAEEPNKKSKKGLIITLSIVGVLLIGIVAAYLGISSYFKDKFVMGTNVNGIDCSEKTLAEVEAMLQKQVEEYAITVHLTNGESEVIKGTDMGIKYGGYKQ